MGCIIGVFSKTSVAHVYISYKSLSLHDSIVTMYADDTSLAYASSSIDGIVKS